MTTRKFQECHPEKKEPMVINVATRLLEVIGASQTVTAWGKEVGIAGATLHGILEKGTTPSTKNLMKIAQSTDISLNWLLLGRGPKTIHGGNTLSLATPETEARGVHKMIAKQDAFLLPRVDRLAQQLNLTPDSSILLAEELAFRTQWLKHRLQVDPERIVLILIKGDAMEPTLKDGDMVMVDSREEKVRYDALYAIQIDGVLAVKRIQRDTAGSLMIHSDNAEYERILVSAEQVRHLKVVGLVVWVGRKI